MGTQNKDFGAVSQGGLEGRLQLNFGGIAV